LFIEHESMAAQTMPFPEYPGLHVHVAVVALVDMHIAVCAQSPLFTEHAPMPAHVCPSPV
jgi:hypothetical protein